MEKCGKIVGVEPGAVYGNNDVKRAYDNFFRSVLDGDRPHVDSGGVVGEHSPADDLVGGKVLAEHFLLEIKLYLMKYYYISK